MTKMLGHWDYVRLMLSFGGQFFFLKHDVPQTLRIKYPLHCSVCLNIVFINFINVPLATLTLILIVVVVRFQRIGEALMQTL